MVLFLCGPHCSGKTTILKKLLNEKRIDYFGHEIGKEFFYKRKSYGFKTEETGIDFEFEVTHLELNRDISLNDDKGIIGIETWHPGNLAYALNRNPHVFSDLLNLIKQKSPLLANAKGIWFRVSRDNIKRRTLTFSDRPDWAAEFYTKIDSLMKKCLNDLEIFDHTTMIDANKPFVDVYNQVIQFMDLL